MTALDWQDRESAIVNAGIRGRSPQLVKIDAVSEPISGGDYKVGGGINSNGWIAKFAYAESVANGSIGFGCTHLAFDNPCKHGISSRYPALAASKRFRFQKPTFLNLPTSEIPTMIIQLDSRFRRRFIAAAIILGGAASVSSTLYATPVDGSRTPEIALAEPQNQPAPASRPEVSLLAPPQAESVSIGDLPSVMEASPSDLTEAVADATGELLQTRFADGKLQIERYVTEDAQGNLVNHGPYKEYDASGRLLRSGRFEMGQLDGNWSQVISTEAVQSLTSKLDAGFKPPFKSEASFVLGQLHGDWTVIDSKGNPVFVWQFEFDKRENVSTWFDSRHVPMLEVLYRAGVPDGPATQVVAGQKEPRKIVYDKGRVVQTKTNWYEQGKRKRSEESFMVPASSLIVAHDWWSSTVKSEAPGPADAVRHGAYIAWHPNGQKSLEGQFENGEPTGEFRWWYANGQPQTKGFYDQGQSIGEWVWWHPNGMKMIEGNYDLGKQVGQWSQWDTSGSLTMRDDASSFPVVKQDLNLETFQVAESRTHTAPGRPVTGHTNHRRTVEARTASKRLR
jgi:antitoxin component YwqK of YwqJK toxin-antitoxin module